MVMCPICGAGNADTAKFCNECGKALTSEGVGTVLAPRSTVSTTVQLSSEPTAPVAPRVISPTVIAFEPTIAAVPPVLQELTPTVPTPTFETTMAVSGSPLLYEPTVRGEIVPPLVSSEPTVVGGPPLPTGESTVAYSVPPTTVASGLPSLQPVGRSEPTPAVPPAMPAPSSEPTPQLTVRPPAPPSAPEQPGAFPDFRQTLDRIQRAAPLTPSVRKADILFVVDCTGSMQGEIDAIRDTILDFVAEIERDGIRVRVGLLAFGDRFNGEESFVFRFDGETFTKDATVFRREVSRLRAGGGGDIPESSLDALLLAVRQPFATDASRVIVLVTDAPPHVPDVEAQSIAQVSSAIQSSGIKQLYLVIRTQDPTSGVYLTLLEGTQGLAFELGSGENFRARAENFKKTLRALGRTISTGTR